MSNVDQGSKRTNFQQIKAMGVHRDLHKTHNFNKTQIAQLGGAISPIFYGFKAGAPSLISENPDTAALVMAEYADSFRLFLDILEPLTHSNAANKKTSKQLTTVGPASIAIYTLKYVPHYAVEFWTRVASQASQKPKGSKRSNTPEMFAKWLTEFSAAINKVGSNGGHNMRVKITKASFFCIHNFSQNKSVTVKQINEYIDDLDTRVDVTTLA